MPGKTIHIASLGIASSSFSCVVPLLTNDIRRTAGCQAPSTFGENLSKKSMSQFSGLPFRHSPLSVEWVTSVP